MRKIELMHHLFGTKTGFCKDCEHFYRKQYSGEGTDWKATYMACGLYPDVPYNGRKIVELAKRGKTKELGSPLEGQIKMEV